MKQSTTQGGAEMVRTAYQYGRDHGYDVDSAVVFQDWAMSEWSEVCATEVGLCMLALMFDEGDTEV